MSKRDLAWGGVSLAMVGLGFGLGSLEAADTPPTSSPIGAVASRAWELASAPESAPGSLPQRASGSSLGSSSPVSAHGSSLAIQAQAPVASARASAPQASTAPSLPPLPILEARPAPILLDRDAEALVRILMRVELTSSEDESLEDRTERRQEFVIEIVRDVARYATETQKARLVLAVSTLVPERDYWQWSGDPPRVLVDVRRDAYEQQPTPENLAALLRILSEGNLAETVDKGWIEQLARANPNDQQLQQLLVSVAPERAAAVFAEGGLTHEERDLLIDVVARTDPARAGLMARELLLETMEVSQLVSAAGYDPKGTAAFLAERRGDPVWEELAAMSSIHLAYENSGRVEISSAVEDKWRQLSTAHLVEALEMLSDESWTPLEDEILARILASGDADLAESATYMAPPETQWKLRVEQDRAGGADWEVEVERFLEFLDEAPFRAKANLEGFYRLLPTPSEKGSLQLAQSFQEKGDPETAKAIMKRVPAGSLRSRALAHLEASLSLQDLEEEMVMEEAEEAEEEDE